MSEFEKYIEAKYPNRSPKILFQKFKDIDGTVFYAVREIEDQAEVWSHQQAKIDDSENTRAVLYRENTDIREKNTDLQAKIDDLEKQLDMMKYINDEQSKNIQNAFKTIEIEQGFKDELQKRIDAVKAIMNEYYTGSFDESAEMAGLISLALRGEHEWIYIFRNV